MKTASFRIIFIVLSVLASLLTVFLPGMAEGDLTREVEASAANTEYIYNEKTHSVISR